MIWNETTHAKSTNSLHAVFVPTMQLLAKLLVCKKNRIMPKARTVSVKTDDLSDTERKEFAMSSSDMLVLKRPSRTK